MNITIYNAFDDQIQFKMLHLSPAAQAIGKKIWKHWVIAADNHELDSYDRNRAMTTAFMLPCTYDIDFVLTKSDPRLVAFRDFYTELSKFRKAAQPPRLIGGTEYVYPIDMKFELADYDEYANMVEVEKTDDIIDPLVDLLDIYMLTVNKDVYGAWLKAYDSANAIVTPKIDLSKGIGKGDDLDDDEKKSTPTQDNITGI